MGPLHPAQPGGNQSVPFISLYVLLVQSQENQFELDGFSRSFFCSLAYDSYAPPERYRNRPKLTAVNHSSHTIVSHYHITCYGIFPKQDKGRWRKMDRARGGLRRPRRDANGRVQDAKRNGCQVRSTAPSIELERYTEIEYGADSSVVWSAAQRGSLERCRPAKCFVRHVRTG